LQRVQLAAHPKLRFRLAEESWAAFIIDDPDYVVTFRETPIMWHSTTRGNSTRKDKSAWEWVSAELSEDTMSESVWRKHKKRADVIVDTLNGRIIAGR
jgi:hypothetical protein